MIKVFENFDYSRVGQMQSLLEAHGIRTFVRNQFGSSVMGEVPFVEVVPQLFVFEERDVARALDLLKLGQPPSVAGSDWICSKCRAEVDGAFDRCWNCEGERD